MIRRWIASGLILGTTSFSLYGQEATPAATLGIPRPAATLARPVPSQRTPEEPGALNTTLLIRAQEPEFRKVENPVVMPKEVMPKEMPKAKITEGKEDPGISPKSSVIPPVPNPITSSPVLPAPNPNTGPILPPPGGGMYSRPITSTPLMAPGHTITAPVMGSPVIPGSPVVPGSTIVPGQMISGLNCDPAMGQCAVPNVIAPFVDHGRWYGSTEYLYWFMKTSPTPVIATVGPATSRGALGEFGVQPAIGGDTVNPSGRSGGRVRIGRWLGESQLWALEGSLFILGERGELFGLNSASMPLATIARPFNAVNMLQNPIAGQVIPGSSSEIVASPGLSMGTVGMESSSALWGAEANLRRKLWGTYQSRIDLLLGYRYLRLDERIDIGETIMGVGDISGLMVSIQDRFRTTNNFHGPQIGAIFQCQRGRWSFDFTTKVAMGVTNQSTEIHGASNTFGTAAMSPLPGGLLAVNSNIGTHTQDRFAVVPEFGLNVGYRITNHVRVFVGYNFLYISSVARPGDQIDTNLDVTRVPFFANNTQLANGRVLNSPFANNAIPFQNAMKPAVVNKETDFFVQGVSLGFQVNW